MRHSLIAIAIAGLAASAGSAQNNVTPAPAGQPAPAPKAEAPAPVVIAPPPPVVTSNEATTPAAAETTPAPAQSQVPSEPVTISPDAEYPNGFADPEDPFANDAATAAREESGFDWGLLGLLGLLGLIPLFRKGGRTRTIYVDRDDPRRVIREEEQ
ncbi:hypothetical protein GCM10023232_29120 [Sphingosinicella ginsenosidimutans]|uniref:Uncharacterized protein n=1 Tax=Allosphingosinicella ginsenosidimutans TaxID=1176539 RepID=A0A5C6TSB0_9SPHN|nr:WGxxGxxG family protein [Sphingosinicella ginsenosidimutans]TXC63080.1 hypothetical protein FRZ32_05025 [Sphingosinicella ginsenosidimutans]